MHPLKVWPGSGKFALLLADSRRRPPPAAGEFEPACRCALGHLGTFPGDSWQLDFIVLTFATRKTY